MTNLPSNMLDRNPNKENILKCTILIIDDDFLSRTVIRKIFKSHGFSKLIEAENGKEGLEKLRAEKPDLVITDMMMPVMDGFEFCKQVRSDKEKTVADVPILVQTAMNDLGDKAPIYNAGATDYLSKPIDASELIARSVSYLEQAILFCRVKDLLASKP